MKRIIRKITEQDWQEVITNSYNQQSKLAQVQSFVGKKIVLEELIKNGKIDYIITTELGKPYLKHHSFEFSISHKENWVAVVISNKKVGIDIETIRPISLNVKTQFATEQEQCWIGDSPFRLLTLFTLKEAYLKMLGSTVFLAKEIEFQFQDTAIYSSYPVSFELIQTKEYICACCEKKRPDPTLPIPIQKPED